MSKKGEIPPKLGRSSTAPGTGKPSPPSVSVRPRRADTVPAPVCLKPSHPPVRAAEAPTPSTSSITQTGSRQRSHSALDRRPPAPAEGGSLDFRLTKGGTRPSPRAHADVAMENPYIVKLLQRRPDMEECIKRRIVQEMAGGGDTESVTESLMKKQTHLRSIGHVYGFCLQAVGSELWGAIGDESIGVCNGSTGKFIKKIHGHTKLVKCFTHGDGWVWSGSYDCTVVKWSSQGKLVKVLEGHKAPVKCLLHVREGIWSGSADGELRLWDLDGNMRSVYQMPRSHAVNCLVHVGDRVWTGGDDRVIRVFNMKSGHLEKKLQGHSGHISSLIHAHGCVWSASRDMTIAMWNAETFALNRKIHGHTRGVTALACAGKFVFSGSSDGTVRVYDSENGSFVRELDKHQCAVASLLTVENPPHPFTGILVSYIDRLVTVYDVKSFKPLGKFEFKLASDSSGNILKGSSSPRTLPSEHLELESDDTLTCLVNHFLRSEGSKDNSLAAYTPTDRKHLVSVLAEGVVPCKILNHFFPNTIDERCLVFPRSVKGPKGSKRSAQMAHDNANLCINAARAIGCPDALNISALEFASGKPDCVLPFMRDLFEYGYLAQVNVEKHPEVVHLLEEGEQVRDLYVLGPTELLLRWFNYHVRKEDPARTVTNFSSDIQDSVNYTLLLDHIPHCDKNLLHPSDPKECATAVLARARKLEIDSPLSPTGIVEGNGLLNLAFTSCVFHKFPGLPPVQGVLDTCVAFENREERAHRMWINRMGIDNYVTNVFEDLSDGIVLLQIIDKLKPGSVKWTRVNKDTRSLYHKVENCDYAVQLAKSTLGLSLVGISGKDIVDMKRMPVLAIVSQLMRADTLAFLSTTCFEGQDVTEASLVHWANQKVKESGGDMTVRSLSDASIKTSVFLLHLIRAIDPRVVEMDRVLPGTTPSECESNAKYAISAVWRAGCATYVSPSDITKVKSSMLLYFVGDLMILDRCERMSV